MLLRWQTNKECGFTFKVIVLGGCPVCQVEVCHWDSRRRARLYFPRVAPAAAPGAHCGFSDGGTQSGRRLTSEHAEISHLKEHKVRDLSSLWHGQNISAVQQTADFRQTLTDLLEHHIISVEKTTLADHHQFTLWFRFPTRLSNRHNQQTTEQLKLNFAG